MPFPNSQRLVLEETEIGLSHERGFAAHFDRKGGRLKPPTIAFDVDQAQHAAGEWGFNCGPSSVCAVTGMTPDQIRPHLCEFEQKGYTNPRLMYSILAGLEVPYRKLVRPEAWGMWGLARVQWEGPWTEPGAHHMARQRHTHWIAYYWSIAIDPCMIFDINAMCVGGWLNLREWSSQLVPWLLNECEPKANGEWHLTHRLELIEGNKWENNLHFPTGDTENGNQL